MPAPSHQLRSAWHWSAPSLSSPRDPDLRKLQCEGCLFFSATKMHLSPQPQLQPSLRASLAHFGVVSVPSRASCLSCQPGHASLSASLTRGFGVCPLKPFLTAVPASPRQRPCEPCVTQLRSRVSRVQTSWLSAHGSVPGVEPPRDSQQDSGLVPPARLTVGFLSRKACN